MIDGRRISPPSHEDGRATGFQPVLRRHGAYLPHWTRDSATYSVTFRLADSLPQSVLMAWRHEQNNIIHTAQQMHRPLTEIEESRLRYLFSEKVENYLDTGRGACWMLRSEVAEIVQGALKRFDGDRYRLIAWAVMPNHVHVVVQPRDGHALSSILHTWKSYTANQANRVLQRSGEFWQVEYYDHLIRNTAELSHAIGYVLKNPEKAGLQRWPWVGVAHEGQEGRRASASLEHGQDGRATTAGSGSDSGTDASGPGATSGTGFQPVQSTSNVQDDP